MELTVFKDYNEYHNEVSGVLNRTVEDFVYTGYLLKQGRDTDILNGSGYSNVNEFAWGEYKLDATQVSRYIRINDKFSEGGYSPRLKAQYQGFGYAKLALMLTLPDEVVEELTPGYSKSEIQTVKEEIESEEKITDIEVLLEEKNEAQEEMGMLEKAFHELFLENPELYVEMAEFLKHNGTEHLKEFLVPDTDKIYSIRIQGTGKVLIYMNDKKEDITIHAIRQQEKEQYSWEQVTDCVSGMTDPDTDPKKQWEEIYGQEFPQEEEPEIAPVQRKKPKVEKAKKPPKKPEKKKQPEPEKKQEETKEKKEEQPAAQTEIPGQTELTKDFPEYCPTQTRKAYIDNLTTADAAVYISHGLNVVILAYPEKVQKWLEQEVDSKGEPSEK